MSTQPVQPNDPHSAIARRPRLDEDAAIALADLRDRFGGISTSALMKELHAATTLLLTLKTRFAGMDSDAFNQLVSDFLPENNEALSRITEAADDAGVPRAQFIIDAASKHLNRIDGMSGRSQEVHDRIRKGIETYAAAGRPISQGRIALDFAGGNKRAAKAFWEENAEWITQQLAIAAKNAPPAPEKPAKAPQAAAAAKDSWGDDTKPVSTETPAVPVQDSPIAPKVAGAAAKSPEFSAKPKGDQVAAEPPVEIVRLRKSPRP